MQSLATLDFVSEKCGLLEACSQVVFAECGVMNNN